MKKTTDGQAEIGYTNPTLSRRQYRCSVSKLCLLSLSIKTGHSLGSGSFVVIRSIPHSLPKPLLYCDPE